VDKKGRMVVECNKGYELRESPVPYGSNFTPENGLLKLKNTHYWDENN